MEKLRRELKACKERLAERDQAILELSRDLRNVEDLRRILDIRTGALAEKEREVSELTREVARRNNRLARLEQPNR